MKTKSRLQRATTAVGHNPLEGEQLLLDALYGARPSVSSPSPSPASAPPAQRAKYRKARPEHYKVVSISLYVEDIERLEHLVRELKRRGHHKANKSQLIRQALAQVDLDEIAREA